MPIHFSSEAELESKLRAILKEVAPFCWMTPKEISEATGRHKHSISRSLRAPSCPKREWKTGPSGRIISVLVTPELLAYLRK